MGGTKGGLISLVRSLSQSIALKNTAAHILSASGMDARFHVRTVAHHFSGVSRVAQSPPWILLKQLAAV